jgi:hypothetical protein
MLDTDQKKMTDCNGKMKQTGHSGDKKGSYSVLAACLEEGPKHSISTSFRGVPKHQSSTPQERSRSTSVQKGVEPKKVCVSFQHRSSIQHKYPTLQRRYLVMSDVVRIISMHCSLSGCVHSKTPSFLLFQRHQWTVIKKS